MKTYPTRLQNPLWQKKRLDILNRDDFTCQLCGDKETELHIHHKSYTPGKQPWEYKDENLITYCAPCHKIVEYITEKGGVVLKTEKVGRNNVSTLIICSFKSEDRFGGAVFFYDYDKTLRQYTSLWEDALHNLLAVIEKSKL